MLRKLMILGALVWGSMTLADAPTIPGQDERGFQDARLAWLDGDDLVALGALKDLAEGGNAAAQILLARIAEEPHMHRHVTGNMERNDRIALLRRPGGLSGTSWLETAREGSNLAEAMIGSKVGFTSVTRADGSEYSPEADAAVQGLLDYGEVELATEVVFKLFDGFFLEHTLDLITTYQDDLSPVIAPIQLATEQSLAVIDVLGEDGVIDSGLFDLFRSQRDAQPPEVLLAGTHSTMADIARDPELQQFIKMHAEKVETWTPLREMCEVSCAPSYSDCLLAGAASMSAGRKFPFASPAQSLISTEDYWNSPRMRADAARRMFEVQQRFKIGASFDQCFAETVTALAR